MKAGTAHNHRLREWISGGQRVDVSALAWAEFLCGPVSDEDRASAAEMLPDAQPLLKQDAALGAQLYNDTGRRRGSLIDCLIAATCLRLDATLATADRDDFRRFEPMGLRLSEP